MEFVICSADVAGNAKNCRYPNRVEVHDENSLALAVRKDHVCGMFRNNYRSKENFLESDVVVMDCDNDHSEKKEDWMNAEKLNLLLPDVAYALVPSRNHMKQKEGKSARPRFHVYFPIGKVTSGSVYSALKEEIYRHFPFFDGKALDCARFIYGAETGAFVWHEGKLTIDQIMDSEEDDISPVIQEGSRNSTLHRYAVRVLKRYGNTAEARERFYKEADKCIPCLEDEELRNIWRSASKYYGKIASQPGYVSPENYNGTAPITWEEPIPFGKFLMAKFPVDALPPAIGEYVAAQSESTQTPVDMAGSIALAMIATCMQGKYRIQGKADWTEPLNVYAVSIAAPSERKSAVLNAMAKPIYEFEGNYNRGNEARMEENQMAKRVLEKKQRHLEELIAKGKAQEEEMKTIANQIASFVEVKPLKLFVDDITPEKMVSVLAENDGRVSLISSEGGIFDTLAGAYAKTVNIDVFLKGYSGDVIRVDRVGRNSETIMDPVLTIFLMAQPNVIAAVLANRVFTGRGLTARFLYSMPESEVGRRKYRSETVDPQVYLRYEACIRNLLSDEYKSRPELIMLSPEADVLLEEFAEELEPKLLKEYAEISDWVGKLVGNTLRIAGLLCRAGCYRANEFLSGNPEPLVVDEKTMKNAIRIGRYFLNHAQAVFSVLPEEAMCKKAEKILKMLKENDLHEFDRRTGMRKCRYFKTVAEIQPVLDFLEDYGYIAGRFEETAKGRKQAITYEVNPWIFE